MCFGLFAIAFFYSFCFYFTSSEAETERLASERVFSYLNKTTQNRNAINFVNISFLKNLKTRIEDLKIKLQKDNSAKMVLTKAELQDFLNLNPEFKSWQNFAEYRVNDYDITMNLFYPVNKITLLKYLPGISSRTCHLKLVIQPVFKENALFARLNTISLPDWSKPLKVKDTYWKIELPEEEWKYLKTVNLSETGVYLSFEKKMESGR